MSKKTKTKAKPAKHDKEKSGATVSGDITREYGGKNQFYKMLTVLLIFLIIGTGVYYLVSVRDSDNDSDPAQGENVVQIDQALEDAVAAQNEKIANGDTEGAAQIWREFAQANPNRSDEAKSQEVSVYVQSGQSDKAAEIVATINDEGLDSVSASAVAVYYESVGDFASAAKYYYLTADLLEASLEERLAQTPGNEFAYQYDIDFMRNKAKSFEEAAQ